MDKRLVALPYLQRGDALTSALPYLLLAMSLVSWCVLLGKAWLLWRARRQAGRALRDFWLAPTLAEGLGGLRRADREGVFWPLAEAAVQVAQTDRPAALLAHMTRDERALRQALQRAQRRLEFGQVLLASVGSAAPFIGLLGMVWGIYHALGGLAAARQAALEQVAGPVGQALVMTALGLVVAIPAVLGYNVLGRMARHFGEELDGFAHDLHTWVRGAPRQAAIHDAR